MLLTITIVPNITLLNFVYDDIGTFIVADEDIPSLENSHEVDPSRITLSSRPISGGECRDVVRFIRV